MNRDDEIRNNSRNVNNGSASTGGRRKSADSASLSKEELYKKFSEHNEVFESDVVNRKSSATAKTAQQKPNATSAKSSSSLAQKTTSNSKLASNKPSSASKTLDKKVSTATSSASKAKTTKTKSGISKQDLVKFLLAMKKNPDAFKSLFQKDEKTTKDTPISAATPEQNTSANNAMPNAFQNAPQFTLQDYINANASTFNIDMQNQLAQAIAKAQSDMNLAQGNMQQMQNNVGATMPTAPNASTDMDALIKSLNAQNAMQQGAMQNMQQPIEPTPRQQAQDIEAQNAAMQQAQMGLNAAMQMAQNMQQQTASDLSSAFTSAQDQIKKQQILKEQNVVLDQMQNVVPPVQEMPNINDVNLNVELPQVDIEIPKVEIPQVELPKVDEVPQVELPTQTDNQPILSNEPIDEVEEIEEIEELPEVQFTPPPPPPPVQPEIKPKLEEKKVEQDIFNTGIPEPMQEDVLGLIDPALDEKVAAIIVARQSALAGSVVGETAEGLVGAKVRRSRKWWIIILVILLALIVALVLLWDTLFGSKLEEAEASGLTLNVMPSNGADHGSAEAVYHFHPGQTVYFKDSVRIGSEEYRYEEKPDGTVEQKRNEAFAFRFKFHIELQSRPGVEVEDVISEVVKTNADSFYIEHTDGWIYYNSIIIPGEKYTAFVDGITISLDISNEFQNEPFIIVMEYSTVVPASLDLVMNEASGGMPTAPENWAAQMVDMFQSYSGT